MIPAAANLVFKSKISKNIFQFLQERSPFRYSSDHFLHKRQPFHLFYSCRNEVSDSYLFGFLSQECNYRVLNLLFP